MRLLSHPFFRHRMFPTQPSSRRTSRGGRSSLTRSMVCIRSCIVIECVSDRFKVGVEDEKV